MTITMFPVGIIVLFVLVSFAILMIKALDYVDKKSREKSLWERKNALLAQKRRQNEQIEYLESQISSQTDPDKRVELHRTLQAEKDELNRIVGRISEIDEMLLNNQNRS